MTDEEMSAIEQRCQRATPGPWHVWPTVYDGSQGWAISHDADGEPAIGAAPCSLEQLATTAADSEFIAAARNDVPALLAEVRRLRECLARANSTMEQTERGLYLKINALEDEQERLRERNEMLEARCGVCGAEF